MNHWQLHNEFELGASLLLSIWVSGYRKLMENVSALHCGSVTVYRLGSAIGSLCYDYNYDQMGKMVMTIAKLPISSIILWNSCIMYWPYLVCSYNILQPLLNPRVFKARMIVLHKVLKSRYNYMIWFKCLELYLVSRKLISQKIRQIILCEIAFTQLQAARFSCLNKLSHT